MRSAPFLPRLYPSVFIFLLLILAASFARAADQQANRATLTRPNILWIISDDLNPMIGAMGHRQVQTPNIDRLARRGTLFRNAYSSWTACLPARQSFLSGWQPSRAPIFDWTTHHSRKGVYAQAIFLPEHFKAQGYFTGRLDKVFHIGKDDPQSWTLTEEPFRDENGQFKAMSTPKEIPGLQLESKIIRGGVFPEVQGETGTYAVLDVEEHDLFDGITTRRAQEILRERAKATEPFLLAVGLRRPHLPWIAPKKYFDLYPYESIELPPRAADGGHAPVDAELNRKMIAHYYASTTFLDTMVGEILGELERLGLAENTIVVLHGDHGYLLGERGGRFGKSNHWERSLHTPLIFAGPGVLPGASRSEIVSLIDLYPTFVELAGIKAPNTALDGRSMARLLRKGHDPAWRDYAVTFSGSGREQKLAASIRTPRYRYIENSAREGVELTDMLVDPYERNNLVNRPEMVEVQAELKALLASEWKPEFRGQ